MQGTLEKSAPSGSISIYDTFKDRTLDYSSCHISGDPDILHEIEDGLLSAPKEDRLTRRQIECVLKEVTYDMFIAWQKSAFNDGQTVMVNLKEKYYIEVTEDGIDMVLERVQSFNRHWSIIGRR